MNKCYQPPQKKFWRGRSDLPDRSCFFQIMQLLDLNQSISLPSTLTFALLGFCSDAGIERNLGRLGAKEGPDAIRQALAKLALQRKDVLCYDAGDVVCLDGDLEEAQYELGKRVSQLLQHQIVPIVIGGGHELAFGHYQGLVQQFPKENIGIINFDAHFDMRPLLENNQGSSGTPFLQIAKAHEERNKRFNYLCIGIQAANNIPLLFDTAKEYEVKIVTADDLCLQKINEEDSLFSQFVLQNDSLYLSLCLDVFAAAFAPGVSAPQPMGLAPWQVIPLFRKFASTKKIISYDIAELSPAHDIDQRTARLAAHFVYEIIHHHSSHFGNHL